MGQTLYDKLWNSHVVARDGDGSVLLYVDRHLIHEVSTPQAFLALAEKGLPVRAPLATLATVDHAVPTRDRGGPVRDEQAAAQIARLYGNCANYGVPLIRLDGAFQGIVHVVGPELGFTLPGTTLACGDSHTSTHGALGALAFGIGASECAVVLATQCVVQHRARRMLVRIEGALHPLVSAKDLSLALIAAIGANGAAGHAVEYAGSCVRAMSMEARMTLCNMSIEAGAKVGLVAPDETTFAYLKGRPMAPGGADWNAAVAYWRTLATDEDAEFDRVVELDATTVTPHVTWGTSPQDALPIGSSLPDPAASSDPARRHHIGKALAYMGLTAGGTLDRLAIDKVFIGSCTNGRIEDLRAAAEIVRGRHIAGSVEALVVPGSTQVKLQAEREGLDRIFREAGFAWRDAGCSMCVAMNDDRLKPGERCASTSNRNFEGRQGVGGRTHLMSPAMAAAAAIAGHLVNVCDWKP